MLELKNISVGYKNRYLIKNVNLTFEPGKVYAVLGKNASGKSDLLRSCTGLLSHGTGEVLLDGEDLTTCSRRRRKELVAYLSQHMRPYNLTVQQMFTRYHSPILFPFKKLSAEEQERLYRALGLMRVTSFAKTKARDLSRGELQRVRIALRLAWNTPVVVLDDPLAYLDTEYAPEIMHILSELKEQGKTIILATRNPRLALQFCDELIVIDGGREFHTGTPKEILDQKILQKIYKVDKNIHNQYDWLKQLSADHASDS